MRIRKKDGRFHAMQMSVWREIECRYGHINEIGFGRMKPPMRCVGSHKHCTATTEIHANFKWPLWGQRVNAMLCRYEIQTVPVWIFRRHADYDGPRKLDQWLR